MNRRVFWIATISLMLLTIGCASQQAKEYEQLQKEAIKLLTKGADKLAAVNDTDSNQSIIEAIQEVNDPIRELAKKMAASSLPQSSKSEIEKRYEAESNAARGKYMPALDRVTKLSMSRLNSALEDLKKKQGENPKEKP